MVKLVNMTAIQESTEVNNKFMGCCGFIGTRVHLAYYTALGIETSKHARKTGIIAKEKLSINVLANAAIILGKSSVANQN